MLQCLVQKISWNSERKIVCKFWANSFRRWTWSLFFLSLIKFSINFAMTTERFAIMSYFAPSHENKTFASFFLAQRAICNGWAKFLAKDKKYVDKSKTRCRNQVLTTARNGFKKYGCTGRGDKSTLSYFLREKTTWLECLIAQEDIHCVAMETFGTNSWSHSSKEERDARGRECGRGWIHFSVAKCRYASADYVRAISELLRPHKKIHFLIS